MAANHNKAAGTEKSLRRERLVDTVEEIVGVPHRGLFFPGPQGHDVGMFRDRFPSIMVTGIEHDRGVIRQQRSAPNLRDGWGDRVRVYLTTFTKFVNGDSTMLYLNPKGVFGAVPPARLRSCFDEKFDCGYIDYVRPADNACLEDVKNFLSNRTSEKFVIAVSNLLVDHDCQFHQYGDLAEQLGLEYIREDYEDSSRMGFGIFIRR